MPEGSEQKDLKQHLNNKPKRTKKRHFREPAQLAKFILTQEPGYVWLDGAEIKRKFPDIYMSEKRINEFIATKEFREAVYEFIPECTQAKASNMFDVLLYRYYKAQIDSPMPHQGALKIFGQISGRYDPTQKMEVYDGERINKDKEKQLNDEIVNALLNRIKREQDKKEGELNGDERS